MRTHKQTQMELWLKISADIHLSEAHLLRAVNVQKRVGTDDDEWVSSASCLCVLRLAEHMLDVCGKYALFLLLEDLFVVFLCFSSNISHWFIVLSCEWTFHACATLSTFVHYSHTDAQTPHERRTEGSQTILLLFISCCLHRTEQRVYKLRQSVIWHSELGCKFEGDVTPGFLPLVWPDNSLQAGALKKPNVHPTNVIYTKIHTAAHRVAYMWPHSKINSNARVWWGSCVLNCCDTIRK